MLSGKECGKFQKETPFRFAQLLLLVADIPLSSFLWCLTTTAVETNQYCLLATALLHASTSRRLVYGHYHITSYFASMIHRLMLWSVVQNEVVDPAVVPKMPT